MRQRVACVQFAPDKGEIEKNLARIGEAITQASQAGAKLVVFPEACVSGYLLEGGVFENARTAEEIRAALEVHSDKLTEDIDVAIGFYEAGPLAQIYNSCGYFELGPRRAALREIHRKIFLPTYGVFDEARYVGKGRSLNVFETRFGPTAILICEDAWHSALPMLCAVRGAELILVPSASPVRGFVPGGIESVDRYRRLIQGISEEHGVWCLNAQLSGFEGGKGLMGGSLVVGPDGAVQTEAPVGGEAIIYADYDREATRISRNRSPLLRDLFAQWDTVRRLVTETP